MNKSTFGAAYEFAMKELGGPLTEVESTVNIASPGAILVQGRGDRVGLFMCNISSNDGYVGLGPTLTASGIFLPALGGAIAFNVRDDFTLPSREWRGFSAASCLVYVLEVFRTSQENGASQK